MKNTKEFETILEDLYMEDVVFSYIENDKKNIKGIYITHFDVELDNDILVMSGGDNIEILYPLKDIVYCIKCENNIIMQIKNNRRFEIGIV